MQPTPDLTGRRPVPNQLRRGRPTTTAIQRFESSLFFLTLKSLSGLSWSALERAYRKDVGLPPPDSSERLQTFMTYGGGIHIPTERAGTTCAVAWALQRFPETAIAQDTVLFELLTPWERQRQGGFSIPPDVREQALLRRLSRTMLNATSSALEKTTRDAVSLSGYELLQALDVVATVDHLDALAVLLVGIRNANGQAETAERRSLCRQWLRRWTLAHPELRRSQRHLWAALHVELPQSEPFAVVG